MCETNALRITLPEELKVIVLFETWSKSYSEDFSSLFVHVLLKLYIVLSKLIFSNYV